MVVIGHAAIQFAGNAGLPANGVVIRRPSKAPDPFQRGIHIKCLWTAWGCARIENRLFTLRRTGTSNDNPFGFP